MFINVFLIWLLKKKGRYFLSIWKFNSKCICNIEKNKLVLKIYFIVRIVNKIIEMYLLKIILFLF